MSACGRKFSGHVPDRAESKTPPFGALREKSQQVNNDSSSTARLPNVFTTSVVASPHRRQLFELISCWRAVLRKSRHSLSVLRQGPCQQHRCLRGRRGACARGAPGADCGHKNQLRELDLIEADEHGIGADWAMADGQACADAEYRRFQRLRDTMPPNVGRHPPLEHAINTAHG